MTATMMKQQFELRARDEWELVPRVEAFRRTILHRGGAVLEICWDSRGKREMHCATVVYELPISAVDTRAHERAA